MRVILWVAILVIGYRGVMAIILNETPANTNSSAPAPAASSSPFPVTLGEAFAMQFGQAYLNFNPATAAQRAKQLAEFIPANVSSVQPQFGWNGGGIWRLPSEQVAGIDVRSANTAVVTLLATVNGHLMELGVPLYASGDEIVVSGEPATLSAPSAATLPSAPQASSDPAAQSALSSQLPAFFQAYASGDQATLNRFLVPGVSISGLDGAVVYSSIAGIAVPRGGATRDINGDRQLDASRAGQDGRSAARPNLRHDGHRPAKRKMVCKGDPCIYAADGNPMTRFASSLDRA